MDRRKILLGIGLLILVAALGVALYWIFFRRPPAPPPPVPPTPLVPITPVPLPPITGVPGVPPTGIAPLPGAPLPGVPAAALPTIAQGGRTQVRALTASPARFTTLGSDGHPRYYDPTRGRFFRLDARGEPIALHDREFPSIQSVAWAPRDDRAILEFPDGANVYFDFTTGEQITLPRHWEQFSFGPRGDQIGALAIGLDRENRFLIEASPDGNNVRPIEPLGSNADKVTVAWSPNDQVVAFSRTGDSIGDGRQLILAIGRHGENFPGLTVEGLDFRPQWSPDGQRILYSAAHAIGDYKPELWIVDGIGDRIGSNRRRLQVATWADKCTFANATTVYCAVPDQLARGAGLEPRIADDTPDAIERIDLTTGARTTVGRPAEDTSIAQLHIATDGSTISYTAKRDGRLYEMKLR